MNWIDLRSDTVTAPTPAMREAMARAEVGDDVFGEDPTINRLEELAAERMGKEAGLFVPSGTMGNLAAFLAHCGRGDEAILGDQAHTFLFEAGGVAALGGIHPHPVKNQPDGTLDLDEIREAIRTDNIHYPVSRLVSLENTHNRCGGVAISLDYMSAVGDLAHENNLRLHLDGARIFNAAEALNLKAHQLALPADSVTFCLSKGLCAPVGSVLCGTKGFIHQARRIRKQLGGGMRQAGILAAAGIVALETMVNRLSDDHRRAIELAAGLAAIDGLELYLGMPQTNMVFVAISESVPMDADYVAQRLIDFRVKAGVVGTRSFRLVTHYWIGDDDIDQTVVAFNSVLKGTMI